MQELVYVARFLHSIMDAEAVNEMEFSKWNIFQTKQRTRLKPVLVQELVANKIMQQKDEANLLVY